MNFNNRNFLILSTGGASIGYLFSNAFGSLSMMILILSFLVSYKQLSLPKNFLKISFFSLTLFYLFILFGSTYTLNMNQAQKEMIRFLSFLIYPIIFSSVIPFNPKERRKIILFYIISILVFFLVCLGTAIYRQITFWNEGGSFNWYFFYRYDFLEVFNQHPTYVSMFTLLALCFLHFIPQKNSIIKNSVILSLISAFLLFAIILYGSRIGYILLLILGMIYTVRLVLLKKFKEVVFIFLSFVTILFFAWNIPIVKERILFTLGENYEYKYNKKESAKVGTEEQGRFMIWQNAWELIKEKPLIGYGTGSSRGVLINKYEEKGHDVFLNERYNAHNTYLELLLWGGILLLSVYLFALGLLLYNAIIRKDLILFSFFLIITITGITETLFIAQGIMFIAFFYCFLNQKYLSNEIR